MKEWAKSLINTIVFGLMYTFIDFLFSEDIDWETVIITTILYGVLNGVFHMVGKKLHRKKIIKFQDSGESESTQEFEINGG